MITADDAIQVLNRVHAADPSVLPALIGYRVLCNQMLADDPTVQVGDQNYNPDHYVATGEDPTYWVGLLGIINGVFGVDDQSRGFIAADYDSDGVLVGFVRTGPPEEG